MSEITVGQRLKQLRQKRGVPQKVIADLLEISIPAYSKIEADITDINISRLFQLAKLYEMSVSALVGGDPSFGDFEAQISELKEQLRGSNTQILELQKKLIGCYERSEGIEREGL